MITYPIPMVPGPVKVPQAVLEAYLTNFGSADLEPDFVELYQKTEANLQAIFGSKNQVVIQTGEGMLALWTALKSCLVPGDRVLAIATGLFGAGIGDMARSIGAVVRTIDFPYNQTVHDWLSIEQAIAEFQPKMITVVHCETPSGTLNPLQKLGELKAAYHIPLLYVDAVSSLGGVPFLADEWYVDLALGGSQKVLSAPAGMSFLTVSEQAWEIVEEVNYPGYEALKPFRHAVRDMYFPYTPYWHGMAALYTATEALIKEGLNNSFQRHTAAASLCCSRLVSLGFSLYPDPSAILSPTITAVHVPQGITWAELDRRMRDSGLVAGGNYGPLANKVFRLGHMGTQADLELVNQACDVLSTILSAL